jgi:hypothetical protein
VRTTLHRISPLLLASVVAGGFVGSSALPATAEAAPERRDRLHSVRPNAATESHRDRLDGVATEGASEIDGRAQEVQLAETPHAQGAPIPAVPGSTSGAAAPFRSSCHGDIACFLVCTRAHESDTSGGYAAVSSGGTYRGAYQFAQRTWDSAVAGAGYEQYVGFPADEAPPEVQDAAAVHLYSIAGNRPWGGRC